jgi:WD40 repeat protein
MYMWDILSDQKKNVLDFVNTSRLKIKHIMCNPHNANEFAAGYGDGTVHIWDIRHNLRSLTFYQAHLGETMYLNWHPQIPNILLSGGQDCKIKAQNTENNT